MHCYANSSIPLRNELNTKEAMKLIAELVEANVSKLMLSGGEPLLRNDLFKILDHIKSYKLTVALSTNGTLVDESVAKYLAKNNVPVQISLDGFLPETHDFIRGTQGSHRKVLKAIKFLTDNNPDIMVVTVANRFNYQELFKIADLCISLGVKKYGIGMVIPIGRARNFIKELALSRQQIRDLFSMFSTKKNEFEDKGLTIVISSSFFEEKDEPPLINCSAGSTTCGISPEGDILPCAFFMNTSLIAGNIRNQTFKEIWQQSELLKFFRYKRYLRTEKYCTGCKFKFTCGRGCRASAFGFYGNIFAPDFYCPFKFEL